VAELHETKSLQIRQQPAAAAAPGRAGYQLSNCRQLDVTSAGDGTLEEKLGRPLPLIAPVAAASIQGLNQTKQCLLHVRQQPAVAAAPGSGAPTEQLQTAG
jgi:hypothetical protein